MGDMWRMPRVEAKTGEPKGTIYWRISNGEFVRPVKLGKRNAGWPSDEVEAINAAKIAGATPEEIRALVAKLHEARKAAA